MIPERISTTFNPTYGIIQHLHRYAFASAFANRKKVLDIACGEGYGSNLIAQLAEAVIGVDIDQETIQKAKTKYQSQNLIFKHGSATSIPCEDSYFDIVISFETIEHLNEHIQMFTEIKRVLKPNGLLILSSPDKKLSDTFGISNKYHVKELKKDELLNLAQRFFSFNKILVQQLIIGSLVSPADDSISKFTFFDGDFNELKYQLRMSNPFNVPFFNILVCSDVEIDFMGYPLSSFYNAYPVYERKLNEKKSLAEKSFHSIDFKLGNLLLKPIRFISWIWKKLN